MRRRIRAFLAWLDRLEAALLWLFGVDILLERLNDCEKTIGH